METVVARCKDGIGSAAAGGGGGGTVGAARLGGFVGGPAGFLAGGQLLARVDANLGGQFGSDARCAGGELQPLDKGLDFSLTSAQRPR